MKLLNLLAICGLFVLTTAFNGPTKAFPSVEVKTLTGKKVDITEYLGNDKITIVSFWATWCSPCKRELDAFSEFYEDWKDEYNVEILAVTIDDARTLAKVPGMVESKGWEFVVLTDAAQNTLKALSFQTIPQTFLVDQKGEIVYTHSGYTPGDEYEMEDYIQKLAK